MKNRMFKKFLMATSLFASSHIVAADTVPALLVIAPNGQRSILIGSFHRPHLSLKQPEHSLLDRKKRLVIEHAENDGTPTGDPKDLWAPEVLDKRSIFANWALQFTPNDVKQLTNNAQCIHTPIKPAELAMASLLMKTPTLAREIAWTQCNDELLNMKSRDAIFFDEAKRLNLPIEVLESTNEIKTQRNQITESTEVHSIKLGLSVQRDKYLQDTVEAINAGDYEKVRLLALSTFRSKAESHHFDKVMLQERNVLWLPRLKTYLDQGDAVVAVGAAHLGGQYGLIKLLNKAGYKAEPIQVKAMAN